jgi:hypothetical protein
MITFDQHNYLKGSQLHEKQKNWALLTLIVNYLPLKQTAQLNQRADN